MNFRTASFCLGWLICVLVSCGQEASEPAPPPPPPPPPVKIICFGGGATAGVGVAAQAAFPALLQGLAAATRPRSKVVNAGIKGERSAGAAERIGWVLQQPFDVLVLELGWEDLAAGPDWDGFTDHLQALMSTVSQANAQANVIILQPLADSTLAAQLAQCAQRASMPIRLIPIPDTPAYWQPDQPYPSREGHAFIAKAVWESLASQGQ